jgi:hypothetical protein
LPEEDGFKPVKASTDQNADNVKGLKFREVPLASGYCAILRNTSDTLMNLFVDFSKSENLKLRDGKLIEPETFDSEKIPKPETMLKRVEVPPKSEVFFFLQLIRNDKPFKKD